MKTFPWQKASLSILFTLILWFYFAGIPSVPFHPDESTQIYMSSDASESADLLAYVPGGRSGDKWRYRLIDSPLSRTMMGWALKIKGVTPNLSDWNWSANWRVNIALGALPSDDALATARWSVAWVFPLTCLFLYLLAKKISGSASAVVAVLLFATNALVLMHTRRAMSESVLLCAVTALVWLMIDIKNKPWFTAIAAAMAVNAKQTAFPLAALAGIEMLILPQKETIPKKALNSLIFFAVILGISWFLNPAYWQHPIDAIGEGLRQRQELTEKMRVDYNTSRNPLEQAIIMTAQIFIQQPMAYDVLNYFEATRPAVDAYMSQPVNTLFRGYTGGAIMLVLSILGWIILWKHTGKSAPEKRLPFLIMNGIMLVFIMMLIFMTAAPFQRYYVILIPFLCIFQSTAIVFLWNTFSNAIKKRTAGTGSPQAG